MDDLISRQATIDDIEKNAYRHTYLEQIIDIVSALPSAQQWIPCSERVPEENEMVLISAKYIGHLSNNAPYVEEGFFTHDGWYSAYGDNYSELLAKVVAWMPLPKPYKEENDEIQ